MAVPKSLKLTESELPSFAQLGHQLAAAAQPGTAIRELLKDQGASSNQPRVDRRRDPGGEH
jgi:hypothetical protein